MAYHELIKNLNSIRDYMRSFFVYGFQSRNEYDQKSARSYDNERRRIESWLGEYMAFRREASGKNVFLTVDSRAVPQNPLYQAYRAKSFTDKDITLHFYILDLLSTGREMTVKQLLEGITEYLSKFPSAWELDESTLRKKLREYEVLGILLSRKEGREIHFGLMPDTVELSSWRDAVAFFSEADPVGVVGAYVLDRMPEDNTVFRFKHHYMLHALDMQILAELLEAMDESCCVTLDVRNLQDGKLRHHKVCPLKIYVSTQNGRQHLLAYHCRFRHMMFFRLDAIQRVKVEEVAEHYEALLDKTARLSRHVWGVSTGNGKRRELEHLEMTIHVEDGEEFIRNRLKREKRSGMVEVLDETTLRFSIDVHDAEEMLPWLRTFIGRIKTLECSNPAVTSRFWEDYRAMNGMYGGDEDAVS